MNIILEYMQQINHTEFDYKYYITAEKGESSVWYRKAFYEQISALGFTVDIRKFKGKQVFCTNKQCNNSKHGFNLQVQAEVDVAIVMKAMEHVYQDQLSSLTLLAGDGDFRDLCTFLKQKADKDVFIFSYKGSHNNLLHKSSTMGYFLDGLWNHISLPIAQMDCQSAQFTPGKNQQNRP